MLKKILIPLDGSRLAEKALPYAKAFAEKFGADLIIVRVAHAIPILYSYGPAIDDRIMGLEQQETMEYLRDIREGLAGVPYLVRVVPLHDQEVAGAIVEFAEREQVDVIVMSTHGRSGMSRWLYGSVATKVLQHAPCPIFVVKVMSETSAQDKDVEALKESADLATA